MSDASAVVAQEKIPPWRYMVKLASYSPWLYGASALFASIIWYVLSLLPALVVSRIFDTISGAAPAGVNLWTLFALLVAIALASLLTFIAASGFENTLHHVINTLLRRNLLAHILRQPGARAAVVKEMSAVPRRHIRKLEVEITLPARLDAPARRLLEAAARGCPVHASLGPDTHVDLRFVYV